MRKSTNVILYELKIATMLLLMHEIHPVASYAGSKAGSSALPPSPHSYHAALKAENGGGQRTDLTAASCAVAQKSP